MSLAEVRLLRETVLGEAERAAQHTLAVARTQAQRIRAAAESEAELEGADLAVAARSDAARYHQEVVGAAVLEARSLKARRREVVLDRAFALAAARLTGRDAFTDDEWASIVELLVREAVAQLDHVGALVVHGDAAAPAVLDAGMLDRIGEATGHRLSLGEALPEGAGVVVASHDGRLRYDNTFEARMARLRPVLRVEVYRILAGEPV
jgi:V/A-type H+/Na+-transporting ATPase subunit E